MTSVKEVMTKKVIVLDEEDSIQDIAKKMKDKGIGSVLITRNNQAVGIITYMNFFHSVLFYISFFSH